MSDDARTDFFSSSAPTAAADQDARTAFFATAANPSSKPQPSYDIPQGPINSAVQGAFRSLVQGAAAPIAGGLRGLWDIAKGGFKPAAVDQAAKNIASTENAVSYHPEDAAHAIGATAMQSEWNPLTVPGRALGGLGIELGDAAESLGAPPIVSAAAKTLPTAIAILAGPAAAIAKRGFAPYKVAAEEPTPTAASVVAAAVQNSKQSMGAAAAAPRLAQASQPLQEAIVDAAQKTGGAVNPDALAAHAEADAHGIQLTKGQALQDPVQFSMERNDTDPRIVKRFNEQEQQMTDALDNIRRDAGPSTVQNNAIQNGQIAVDALKARDAPVKADIKAKYQALVDANGGTVPIDSGAFVSNMDAALKKQYLTSSVPPAGAELLNSLRAGESLDFEGFEAARTRLAEAQRNGGSEGVAAGILRNQLEQLPLSPAASGLKVIADAARGAAKSRFDELEADPAYEAAVNDPAKIGAPSPLADTFLDKYALNAPKANLDLMMQKLGPEGQEAVISHTLSTIRDKAITPNGVVTANGYNGAMEKLGPKLGSLVPDATQESLESLGRVITKVKVAPPGNFVNYSKSGVIMNAAKGMGEAALNAKTFGLGVPVLKGLAHGRWVQESLEPGAGLSDLTQK